MSSKIFLSTLLAVVGAGALGLYLNTGKPTTEAVGPQPVASSPLTASEGPATPTAGPVSMAGLTVRGLDNTTEPLAPREGGVVAVISTTCSHCMRMLEDLAASQPLGGFPALTVFSIQGAAPGTEKVKASGLRVGRVVGPTDSTALRSLVTQLQVKGTPTLFHVQPDGQILHRLTGWSADEQATWQPWMTVR